MLFDEKSGTISIMVQSQGTINEKPQVFVNVPPGFTDVYVARPYQQEDLLNRSDLLINNPENLYAFKRMDLMTKWVFRKDGLIIINQSVDLDAAFGPLNGIAIFFSYRHLSKNIRECSNTQFKKSHLGRQLLKVCQN